LIKTGLSPLQQAGRSPSLCKEDGEPGCRYPLSSASYLCVYNYMAVRNIARSLCATLPKIKIRMNLDWTRIDRKAAWPTSFI